MSSIEHVVIHYGLLILSAGVVIELTRLLCVTLRDIKAPNADGVNGPKRLVVLTREYQSAFLLAVFAVLLGLGGRIALAREYELEGSLVLTLIVAVDTIALLLGLKEWTVRKSRARLEAYADLDMAAQQTRLHVHRRITDVVSEQKEKG